LCDVVKILVAIYNNVGHAGKCTRRAV
jgi:hypothetical protein